MKNGDWVYIFLKDGAKRPLLKEHGSLRIIEMAEIMFDLKVLWNVKLRKKKFDKVIIPSSHK